MPRVAAPTLPRYIKTIIINFERELKLAVNPLLTPTVPMADTISYKISRYKNFPPSIIVIQREEKLPRQSPVKKNTKTL